VEGCLHKLGRNLVSGGWSMWENIAHTRSFFSSSVTTQEEAWGLSYP